MAEVLTVLTYKSVDHIVGDGGTQSWVISSRRAAKCDYVVCVRHQHGPYKAEGSEEHKSAFLVGVVSGVSISSDHPARFRVDISEYAIVDGPHIPLNSASPTQYFPSLSSLGIDAATLDWKLIGRPSNASEAALPTASPASADVSEDAGSGEGIAGMSIIMQAKMLIANHLHIPTSAVEIVIRG